MTRYSYSTKTDKHGRKLRYRHWTELFTDEATGKDHPIRRSELTKVDGVKVRFYSNSELKAMTPAQRKAIEI